MTKNTKVKESFKKNMNEESLHLKVILNLNQNMKLTNLNMNRNLILIIFHLNQKNKITKKRSTDEEDEIEERDFKKIRNVIHKMFPSKYG